MHLRGCFVQLEYVCLYVCVCVRMCAYVCAHGHVGVYTRMYVCMHVCASKHVTTSLCTCGCAHVDHVRACVHVTFKLTYFISYYLNMRKLHH